ncbi:MAG: redoxin domain-containing protein [Bryobacterales bacterium]|nr:redoxin domain-containing protein [Bryobacterales bacterium]
MQAYRDGIAKFEGTGAKVFTISTDNLPSLRYWASEVLKTPVPMLSDFMRVVSAKYGVLNKDRGFANRATFVVGKDGKISYIEEGNTAIDPSAAVQACSRPALSR